MDIRISTEEIGGSFTLQDVMLDGDRVGFAQYNPALRAPKKWEARIGDIAATERIGRFASAEEAAFAVAFHALQDRHKASVLAALGSQS